MTLVVSCNAVLQPRGSVAVLAPRRRRLSTIMARHAGDRRAIPLVFRRGVNWREATAADIDRAARLRSQYSSTLVGPHDTVVLYIPVRGRTAAAIGLALAAIALVAIAGPVAGAFGATGIAAFAVHAASPIGAIALRRFAGRTP